MCGGQKTAPRNQVSPSTLKRFQRWSAGLSPVQQDPFSYFGDSLTIEVSKLPISYSDKNG